MLAPILQPKTYSQPVNKHSHSIIGELIPTAPQQNDFKVRDSWGMIDTTIIPNTKTYSHPNSLLSNLEWNPHDWPRPPQKQSLSLQPHSVSIENFNFGTSRMQRLSETLTCAPYPLCSIRETRVCDAAVGACYSDPMRSQFSLTKGLCWERRVNVVWRVNRFRMEFINGSSRSCKASWSMRGCVRLSCDPARIRRVHYSVRSTTLLHCIQFFLRLCWRNTAPYLSDTYYPSDEADS